MKNKENKISAKNLNKPPLLWIGIGTIIVVFFITLGVYQTMKSTESSNSSSSSDNSFQSTSTGTEVTPSTLTGTGVTPSTPIGTGVTPSTSTGTGVTSSASTGTGVTSSASTGTGVTSSASTGTNTTEPTPTVSSSSSNKPDSGNSSSSTSSINDDPPVIPPSDYLHTEECNGGWLGLKTDHAGDAYIKGSFLSKNKIGKVENGRKINGWMFNLYIDGASVSLIVYPKQSGFSCESKATYENAPAFEHPVHITAEYAENNDIKISFFIEDYSFDLTTLNKISVTSSTTPVASPSSYPRPVYDDNNNGWVGLIDGQTGDAYIYGGFIDEIYNGLKINLYTHGISVSLFVYFDQNDFYYESKQITTYEDAPTYEWPIQISAEYTENGGLMVSFSVEDYAFDLSSLYRVTIEAC